MLESFLIKLQAFAEMQIYQNKKKLQHRLFSKICEIFKNACFEQHRERLLLNFYFGSKPHWLNKIRFIDFVNTFHKDRSSRPKLFCKNVVSKNSQNSQQNTCVGVSL